MSARRRHPGRASGFTLIELLAATALFAVLGAMLFQMVTGAMELWSRGERVRELEERSSAVLELLAEDLRHLWSGPADPAEQDARFLLERRTDGGEGAVFPGRRSSVLRFTRLLHEARSLPWLRRAGERPAAEGVATLVREEDPAQLQPTSGLAESLYCTAVLPGDVLPSLVRRVRTPIGGRGSLLAPELVQSEDRLLTDALTLADRVLYFGVLAWGPRTTVWETSAEQRDGVPALSVWDSTRGLLPPGDADFPFGVGPESLLAGYDDLFPPAVLLELVLDPYDGGVTGPASLAEPVGDQGTRLVLSRSAFGGDDRAPSHVWIEGEWMAVTALNGAQVTVVRGVRGTAARAHEPGVAVRVGQTYRRVVMLPGAREGLGP